MVTGTMYRIYNDKCSFPDLGEEFLFFSILLIAVVIKEIDKV